MRAEKQSYTTADFFASIAAIFNFSLTFFVFWFPLTYLVRRKRHFRFNEPDRLDPSSVTCTGGAYAGRRPSSA